ncbi:MAG: KH domain-containing protein [archaeon]|mgnify:FL=1
MKRIVVPGELVTEERKKAGENVYQREGKIYSEALGIAESESDIARVIPLQGKYMPKEGDVIVGLIGDESFAGYSININSFSPAFFRKEGVRKKLNKGAMVMAKIISVNEVNQVELEDIKPFLGGDLITTSPVKVPRIIGKNGSMLEVLTTGTGVQMVVGKNGRIWVKGSDQAVKLLREAVEKINDEAHLSSLTDRMKAYLDQKAELKDTSEHPESEMFDMSSDEGYGERDFRRGPRRSFGNRRPFGDRSFGPRREGGFHRGPRRDFGDRPRRDFEDSRPRAPRSDFGDRPRSDFGDRPRAPRSDFGDRPRSDFGDSRPRGFGRDDSRGFRRKPREEF